MGSLLKDAEHSLEGFTLLSLALAAIFVFYSVLTRDRRIDTIPGPRGYPIIGIGYQLPPRASTQFRAWALKYGDIFKIRVGWYNWVVLNSPEAIKEVLEKQSLATSSKAPSPMSHDIVTGGNRMPTMPYGSKWRALRTIIRQVTTVPMTNSFIPCQEFEAKQLIIDLAKKNINERSFYQHMRRYAFSIIMTNTFGTRARTMDDDSVTAAIATQAILRRTSRPGAYIADEFPPLQSLPSWLQPGRKDAEQAGAEVLAIKLRAWRQLQKDVEAGTASHCYARQIYEQREQWYAQGLTEEHLIWVTTGLVEAGFETTAAILNTLMLHLAASPSEQDRAAAELDEIVGHARMPIFQDLQRLPYVRACTKEALRLNPILAPGVRHFAEQDLRYKDHIIPKGTVLLANTAFLHFDPSRFSNPFKFQPERYLEHTLYSSEYAAMSDPYKRDHFTFSSGRRVCPGARLAENSLNIALAKILWAFRVCPPVMDGVEVDMEVGEGAYLDGGFTIPKPFAVRFVPRSPERLEIAQSDWNLAQQDGYRLRGVAVDVEGIVK